MPTLSRAGQVSLKICRRSAVTPVVLGMLWHGPLSGYDIKRAVERSTASFWRASYGQLYPELKRLADDDCSLRRTARAAIVVATDDPRWCHLGTRRDQQFAHERKYGADLVQCVRDAHPSHQPCVLRYPGLGIEGTGRRW